MVEWAMGKICLLFHELNSLFVDFYALHGGLKPLQRLLKGIRFAS